MMATRALAEARKPPATAQLRGSIQFAANTPSPPRGVLFIMVRRTEGAAGPPVAALRLDPRGIPGTFTVTDRDMMMGGEWPSQVWIEARLDSDGDPSTKEANDLHTERLGPFSAGAEGIQLVLESSSNQAAAATATPRISGRIEVAQGQTLPRSGAIFVIIRRTSTPQGPPVAAIRLPIDGAPGPFSAGDADIMMGGDWPDEVWVQARADADGNAMTKGNDDLSSPIVGPVKSGSDSIELTLGL